ncbi:MAG: hypothetical protein R3E79_58960 [Caldilineaceae bacterium]
MKRGTVPRLIFFFLIALLLLAELWLSNLGSLTNNLGGRAALMVVCVAAERVRLLILIGLAALGGGGALLALTGYLLDRPALRRVGVLLTTLGLVLYGGYQLVSALTQLTPELRPTMALIGVVYAAIGIVAWRIGMRPASQDGVANRK